MLPAVLDILPTFQSNLSHEASLLVYYFYQYVEVKARIASLKNKRKLGIKKY